MDYDYIPTLNLVESHGEKLIQALDDNGVVIAVRNADDFFEDYRKDIESRQNKRRSVMNPYS